MLPPKYCLVYIFFLNFVDATESPSLSEVTRILDKQDLLAHLSKIQVELCPGYFDEFDEKSEVLKVKGNFELSLEFSTRIEVVSELMHNMMLDISSSLVPQVFEPKYSTFKDLFAY